jgi:vacuolar protein sorting-associated protein 35
MQEALRHSAALLGELRTSLLGPQKYYELYVQVNDELRGLESYFSEEPAKNRSFANLYELVQHAGNVLPRLYLLCTVGACYIRSKEAPAKLLLQDMADMCKGVQHPTRGLFLRAYLVQSCRGLLPDAGSPYEGGEGGDVVDAVEFLLANFTEMNKLWVRMKHQGGPRGQEQRERERAQLADLVGKNLTQLSQLEGLTFQLYRDVVLPRVLEQVVACKDELAQGYLMQCIAAAFPDDFHVGTLEALLGALPQLQPGVKLASVMGSLLERLAGYASREPSVVKELDSVGALAKMSAAASKSIEEHPAMPAADLAAVYSGLLAFSGAVYPDRLDYVDDVLKTCHEALKTRAVAADARAERQLSTLLSSPLEKYGVLAVLGLDHYAPLLSLLSAGKRRETARKIAEALIKSGNKVDSVEKVEIFFSFIDPLVIGVEGLVLDDEDVGEDAAVLARVMHALRAEDPETQYAIFDLVLKKVLTGGAIRSAAVIPPICFISLQTVQKSLVVAAVDSGSGGSDAAAKTSPSASSSSEKWYRFLHRAISALADARAAELALNLFLSAALSSSEDAHLEIVSYEFFEQAFTLFEESIPESKQEVRALQSIVSTLHRCRVFTQDNRGALVHKAMSYCSKLLKRTDQCLAVLSCAHLYWQEKGEKVEEKSGEKGGEDVSTEKEGQQLPVRDGQGVLSCLKRALKIANAAQQHLAIVERKGDAASAPGHLFVEILNSYLYFYDHGVESITKEAVQGVVELVKSEVSTDVCKEDEELQAFYSRTVAYIQKQQGEKYSDLKV